MQSWDDVPSINSYIIKLYVVYLFLETSESIIEWKVTLMKNKLLSHVLLWIAGVFSVAVYHCTTLNLSMLSTKELTAHKNTGFFSRHICLPFVKIIVTDIKDAEEIKIDTS